MAKLSLNEVSQRFKISRSTLYRSIKEGRLSRGADGLFDIAEVIRCFGEPPVKNEETPQKDDTDLRQLVEFMKREIESYKDREQRYLDQIDRFQLLLGHKENSDNLSHETTMKQTNDTPRDTHADAFETTENTSFNTNTQSHETAMTQINDAPRDKIMTHHDTLLKEPRKRGLFGRLTKAFFED